MLTNLIAKNGLALTDLAKSAAWVYEKVAGAFLPGEEWEKIAGQVVNIIDPIISDVERGPFTFTLKAIDLAKSLQANRGLPPWDDLSMDEQLGWEAVARHMVNLIGATQAAKVKLPECEAAILRWAKNAMSPFLKEAINKKANENHERSDTCENG